MSLQSIALLQTLLQRAESGLPAGGEPAFELPSRLDAAHVIALVTATPPTH